MTDIPSTNCSVTQHANRNTANHAPHSIATAKGHARDSSKSGESRTDSRGGGQLDDDVRRSRSLDGETTLGTSAFSRQLEKVFAKHSHAFEQPVSCQNQIDHNTPHSSTAARSRHRGARSKTSFRRTAVRCVASRDRAAPNRRRAASAAAATSVRATRSAATCLRRQRRRK